MTKLEEMGIPADLIVKLFETLNDSDKLTRDQLKELTTVMTRVVIANESRNCDEAHKELKGIAADNSKSIIVELEKIITILTTLTGKVNTMIRTVLVTFGVLTFAITIAIIIAKFVD